MSQVGEKGSGLAPRFITSTTREGPDGNKNLIGVLLDLHSILNSEKKVLPLVVL